MYLVDEEDYVAVGFHHLVDDRLEAFLKLALVLGTCDQRSHVEGVDLLVLQVFRHVAAHYPLCEAFDDGGLACARLADEDRVVLRPSAEDLQHAANLLVTANDRVELAVAGRVVEVDGVFAE